MTVIAAVAVVIAVIAAVRRLARTAVALGIVAVLAGAGPAFLNSVDERLAGVGIDVRSGLDAITGGGDMANVRRPRAVDGDTFKVREDGAERTVRVALVDAGESSATRYGRPTCGGAQAKRFAAAWAARRKSVRLRRVGGLPRADRYARRLARVVDRQGRDYGLAAVRRGWARVTVYEQPRGPGAVYLARLRATEASARRAGRGAWGACDWRNQNGVK